MALATNEIEKQFVAVPWAEEPKKIIRGPRHCVERLVADAAEAPVVLDETQNRALVGDAMVHEVDARVARDHHQRQPWAVAAAIQIGARLRRAAEAWAGERVVGITGMADDRA